MKKSWILLALLLCACVESVNTTKTDAQMQEQQKIVNEYKEKINRYKTILPNERECVIMHIKIGIEPFTLLPYKAKEEWLTDITTEPVTDALVMSEQNCEKFTNDIEEEYSKFVCICEPNDVKNVKQGVSDFFKNKNNSNEEK